MNINKARVLKYKCENSLLFFTRYIFKENTMRKFTVANHFKQIASTLEKVARGEIKRLIINVPPRYGKTELAVKMFIAWGLANNNQAKFIHLSYSDDLALDNSSQSKEYVLSDAYQKFWSLTLKRDAQGKKKWYTEQGGGIYATSAGGAVVGFGAGLPIERTDNDFKSFGGAIIIDDPLKPDDAFSDVKRKAVNNRYNNTIRSRVNDRNTPIIIIMQRLHEDDLSGFLLAGGSGEKWVHLNLPALDKNNIPLWEAKHTFSELEQIRQADRYTFAGQYMQTPSPDDGGEWRRAWFDIIGKEELPPNIKWEMYIDGAYTKLTRNDPTGIQIAGRYKNDLYILSSIDKYLELPELRDFILPHIDAIGVNVRMILIEPKASGKSLAQLLKKETRLNVKELQTDFVKVSKIERARSSSPYIEGGRVHLVKGAWNDAYLKQVTMFPNGKHDEHIDLTSYAVERNLISVKKGFVTAYV